ncbi:hypothetical protein BJV78DRAFT_1350650, partial [Lactifluus subvellereus]
MSPEREQYRSILLAALLLPDRKKTATAMRRGIIQRQGRQSEASRLQIVPGLGSPLPRPRRLAKAKRDQLERMMDFSPLGGGMRHLYATATLCLACSSSLPPRLWKQVQQGARRDGSNPSGGASAPSASGSGSSEQLFLTRCCGRPICPSCLTSNPRLARYNPCLACLGGVGAIDSGKAGSSLTVREPQQVASNVDGAVRDEDVFVVGDEEDEEVPDVHDGEAVAVSNTTATPNDRPTEAAGPPIISDDIHKADEPPNTIQSDPGRYYIRPDDTLLGISLRLGVDARTLCKLNNLPPSTLRTTPHLLHTRTFLALPQSHSQLASGISPEEEAQQTRVRAQVAFQRVTKETDWGIAQAYVALAEDSDSEPDVTSLKLEGAEKKSQQGIGRAARTRTALEERAVDRYLDDDEWERQERAKGRGVHIQRLRVGGPPQPSLATTGRGGGKAELLFGWWRRLG